MTLRTKVGIAAALSVAAVTQTPSLASASRNSLTPAGRLPDISIAARTSAGVARARATTEVTVTITNHSPKPFDVSRMHFVLSAQGDMFGAQESSSRRPPITVAPRRSDTIRVTFAAPSIATSGATLLYRASGGELVRVDSLTAASSARKRVTVPPGPPTINAFPLMQGGAGPWGTAIDRSGDVWFAESECDFGPTCPAGTPPGQIGELRRSSHAIVHYTLPDIPGNQPIFLAFDHSGNLWFTTPDNGKIGEFRPSTRRFVGQWSVGAATGPWDLAFSDRTIWYTEHFVSAVGSFNPVTHGHRNFRTPSANSNPYGIAVNHGLIWFTENNSGVDRVAVLNTRNHDSISEYPIVAAPSGTPHMITIGDGGDPWWTEGWSNTLATLDPSAAKRGRCGRSFGVCNGVQRYALPTSTTCGALSHVSGIAFQGSSGLVWLDDSLTAQVGYFDPQSRTFGLSTLSDCDAHPHDGLILGPPDIVWFDQEFDSAIGELIP